MDVEPALALCLKYVVSRSKIAQEPNDLIGKLEESHFHLLWQFYKYL